MRSFAWYVADGVLHGPTMKTSRQGLAIQSWLAYHRPLRAGDELSYEFYYEPGKKVVYPSLGRIAFVLDPTGVRLHWITDIPHMSIAGLDPDNSVEMQGANPEPGHVPLKQKAWNQVTVKMDAGFAVLLVNGSQVYQHAVSEHDNRMFGFFRYRNKTAAEVRQVVLKGAWPKELTSEQLADPVSCRLTTNSDEECRSRDAMVDERWFELFKTRGAD